MASAETIQKQRERYAAMRRELRAELERTQRAHDATSRELVELRRWRKDAQGTLVHLTARNATLYSALERCVQALATCDGVGEPHPTHDAVITGLGAVAGHGDMMKALVHDWRLRLIEVHGVGAHTADNHFTVGPTRDSLESALRVGRAALGQKT